MTLGLHYLKCHKHLFIILMSWSASRCVTHQCLAAWQSQPSFHCWASLGDNRGSTLRGLHNFMLATPVCLWCCWIVHSDSCSPPPVTAPTPAVRWESSVMKGCLNILADGWLSAVCVKWSKGHATRIFKQLSNITRMSLGQDGGGKEQLFFRHFGIQRSLEQDHYAMGYRGVSVSGFNVS